MTGLEFAAVAIIGVLVGRFLPNRRKGPKAPQPVKPVCGCSHHHSFHDPATGKCGFARAHSLGINATGLSQYETRHCTCLTYSGPVPMPEYYAPEMAGGQA